ncbi:MAG TPA: AAA family ATPase [Pirellulaceae bacterium]|jgi:type II secretory pathway predicted ATPase ExeA|nr:AAA family ATPase [Pirellulaceae bacterium]
MYESLFQFRERPFAAAPQTASYVPLGSIEQARQTLVRCIERAEGVGLVIGPAGTGKTLLCQLVAEHFRQRQFQVALMASARLHTRRSLLQNVLFELNLPYRGMDDEELRLSLIDHLTPRGSAQPGLVLIVDEAHTLPLRLLEEIRLISNFIRDGQPRVRLLLVGGPGMEERLASPKLESLSQRIAARCYLQPFNRKETFAYVRKQIERVGGDPDVVTPEGVLGAIHDASGGIARLINQLCDHACILAACDVQPQLSVKGIEQAWADLQQLPTPWHEPARPQAAGQGAAIEFGQLGDEPADVNATVVLRRGDPLGDKTMGELSQIDDTIQALAEQDESPLVQASEPQALAPIDAGSPEPPSRGSADPFGSGFVEEEVVIDRYASLDARALPPRSHVASVEGQILGEALRHHDEVQRTPAVASAPPQPAAAWPAMRVIEPPSDDEGNAAQEATGAAFNPADDPVLPEPAEAPRHETLGTSAAGSDDRDLIVIQESRPEGRIGLAAPAQRRRRYRQLFSTLRKG